MEPRTGVSVTNGTDDQVTSKLPALQEYQLSIAAPAPPAGSFDAGRGRARQDGVRGRGEVRELPQRRGVHGREQQAARSRARSSASRSRTARPATRRAARPSSTARRRCAGVWQHAPYFHNGSAATLAAVVDTYDSRKSLGLTADQKADLVEYLKSL